MNICTRLLLVSIMVFCFVGLGGSNIVEDIMQMGQDAYNEERIRPIKLPKQNGKYDFIIVGAGSAGCVLANRLSENPNWTVLLLEAGGTENIVNDWPILAFNLQKTPANWNYRSTPQKKACLGMNDNKCPLPRGKMLGGSSGINYMLYTRGSRTDYDRMARAGNFGWSYEEVLPYFLRSEKANLTGLNESPYHNTSGLQSVEFVKYRNIVGDAFVQACIDLGYPEIDYKGESEYGTSYIQATTLNGHRHSAAKAFVLPIMRERKNLHVITFATVTKILIDKTLTAYGVNFVHRGKNYTVRARKEVILSAGVFNSPHVLLLSGVGPKDVLESVGINQLVDVPVGKLLKDHVVHYGLLFTTNTTRVTFFPDRITDEDTERYRNGDPSTRISSPVNNEALTFIKLQNSQSDHPDVELIILGGSFASDYGTTSKEILNLKEEIYSNVYKPLEGVEHFNIVEIALHPKSTGKLLLEDSNPFTAPVIDLNYLDDDDDIDVLLDGIKEAIRITETPAMKRINATLYTKNIPGCEGYTFGTDEYWRCSIRVLSSTSHHQVGSCKMGPFNDSTAVVSPQLKVYGMRKLRVVDLSVMPENLSAHTNAPAIMIGEKAADMIKNDWDYYPIISNQGCPFRNN